MSSIFLTTEELQDLTGYVYPKYQRKWLINEGIPFKANRMGEPKVKRCLFTQSKPAEIQEAEPDFGAI
ncbi:DUF4224 domain-containing protein [Escherichia coli]|uniref:DUF4224 domain-containing protein n=1 Tax=Escherichia coli TaxID=562 RepID=UPI001A91A822|nr:DUF4224 domain-containing protein [Escherichia coli]EIX6821858.1 DUF4224 domain-containing protein [Escherichia coli]ELJ2388711.1 DUF4224 domain-containing protein [Escherichia coli]MBO0272859.1 DUF4224 domain-containing protein [Escherichia coli]HEI3782696.1 DUF4224 domain-containing protein [Escherichia coli]